MIVLHSPYIQAVRRPLVATRLRPVAALLAVALLACFAASAARLTVPGVREKTRATTLVLRAAMVPARANKARALGRDAKRPGLDDRTPSPGVQYVAPARLPLPRLQRRLMAPEARAPGDDALGTGSLSRSARWKVLGGHGRHGAG